MTLPTIYDVATDIRIIIDAETVELRKRVEKAEARVEELEELLREASQSIDYATSNCSGGVERCVGLMADIVRREALKVQP